MSLRPAFILITIMLCRLGFSQQVTKDALPGAAYLFCKESPKGSVPVFAHPCEREPSKVSACGSSVKVIEQDGEWLKLMFEDKNEVFVKAAAVSNATDHFEPVHPAKQSPGYTTPECVTYMVAKAKGQPPPARVKPPRPIFTPDAKYPSNVRGINGAVETWCTVGVDGRVHSVDVVKSLGKDFDAAAIAALKTWRFEPAEKGGKPVETKVQINVSFKQF